MKKLTLIASFLVVTALFWAVPVFPGTIPSSIVPNDARWLAHLDMEKLIGTSLYGYLEKSGTFEIKAQKINGWLKMDFAKDVTGVTIFGLGNDKNDQVVVAIAGKFDRPALTGLIALQDEHKEIPYGDRTIYSTGDDEFGAFVNDHLIVLGDSQAVIQRALDTADSKGRNFTGSALSAALKEVPSGAFLSGFVPNLSGLGKEIGESKMLESANGLFFLAQEKGDTVLLHLQLTADNPEKAKNIADIVQGLMALGRMSGGQDKMSEMMQVLDGLRVGQEGKVIKLDFEKPSKEIADLLSHSKSVKGLLD
jgi:hypothetical protein